MIAFLTHDANFPFMVALLVMLFIALLEGVTTALGAGLSSFLEGLIPDIDIDGPELQNSGAVSQLLHWFRIGEVPFLVLLILFLTAFGLVGLGIQSASRELFGSYMPSAIAALLAVIASVPILRLLGGPLGKIMPKDETEAVKANTFVGRMAVIRLGEATLGSAAQAKLKDSYGQTHYVMVEPYEEGETLEAGTQVLLIESEGAIFRAVRNESAALAE